MFKRTRSLIVLCAASCTLLAVGATSASAAKVYVSNSVPAVPGGSSCAQPTYNKVQEAITAGGGTINVCAGTYTEQVTIVKPAKLIAISGTGTATLAMPAAATNSTTTCDTMGGLEQKDEISICTSGTVSITGLNVEALIPLATCAGGLNGIFIAGGGTLKATSVSVNGASTTLEGAKGCQHGVAIEVGSKTPLEVGHATLKKVTVSGYQKNGPTVKGEGSTLSITSSSITGAGESPFIAQNGIEVAFKAKGTIKSTTVSGNECNVPSCGATGEQASGVLFYGAASGSSLASSTVRENDLGAYYGSFGGALAPSPDVTLSKDVFTDNRYEGVELEEGNAALVKDAIGGSGRVGIEIFQAESQSSGEEYSSNATTITGQSEAAIKVTSDKQPGDKPGKLTFNGSAPKGNGTVLINESNNFEVIF